MSKPNKAAQAIAEFMQAFAEGTPQYQFEADTFTAFCKACDEVEAANGTRLAWHSEPSGPKSDIPQAIADAVGPGGGLDEIRDVMGELARIASQIESMPDAGEFLGEGGLSELSKAIFAARLFLTSKAQHEMPELRKPVGRESKT